ncbi:hypothetical protein [Micromonospora inyonensis]|uniref:Uncharacterized protein n=1 Tax=Micromonospora inyonensis TaxID=47866 RepID=A0A1C6RWM4_9ACTN|nr:hypothetical protein [Micromonospora inyonensis]SCL21575.1 hypothetical protein GA0074694_3075 [Micromonospora inyonensis]SCL21786.1 hypothetical protein GA0074694_3147 [Micromonospora inyonensis]
MHRNSRTHSQIQTTRNALGILAAVLGAAAFAVGAHLYGLQARDRAAAAQREAQRHQAEAAALRDELARVRHTDTVQPGRVHVDMELMGMDPEVAAAARRIHERLTKSNSSSR